MTKPWVKVLEKVQLFERAHSPNESNTESSGFKINFTECIRKDTCRLPIAPPMMFRTLKLTSYVPDVQHRNREDETSSELWTGSSHTPQFSRVLYA
jgi:hypothetical protein